MSDPDGLPVVPLSQASFWCDPHPVLAAAREQAPAGRTDSGHVIVLRRDLVDRVMRDPARFHNIMTSQFYAGEPTAIDEHWRHIMGAMMPPEHTRLRGIVSSACTPRRTAALRPLVADWAAVAIREAVATGRLGLDSELLDIPVRVIAHLLGVPDRDQQWFCSLGLRFGGLFATDLAQDEVALRAVSDAISTLTEYAATLVAARRRRPTGDLLSDLVQARDGADRLAEVELVNLVVNLMWAGVDTTRAALPMVLSELAKVPAQLDRVRQRPELVPGAVEEALRLEPPVFHSVRRCVADVEHGGVTFRAGEFVQLNHLAASRDPEAWERPDEPDLQRPGVRSLAFGQGLHYCLGASLARAELQVVIATLLAHTRELALESEPHWRPFTVLRHLENVELAVAG